MRIFVTGATGFVGSAVVQELLSGGHQVLGLARSDASADALKNAGVDVLRGGLTDLDTLRQGAQKTDGTIHTAFNHDFSKFAESCENDFNAIEAMGAELVGTQRPFLTASGVAMLVPGRVATEADMWPEDSPLPRRSEAAVANLVAQDVNASAVRLPPSVHGRGDQGFAAALIALAREKGMSAYIGEGANQWAAVHRFDAARVFRLAIARENLDGPYHAVAEEGVPFKDIATLIGKRLDVPVASISAEEAAPHFTWMAMFAGMESAASSVITQRQLGWAPEHPTLLSDLEAAGYF